MKTIRKIFVILLTVIILPSCATIFGGPVNDYQRTKPLPGKPQREVRVGALIADIILFPLSLVVDFGTGAIYKPEPRHESKIDQQKAHDQLYIVD